MIEPGEAITVFDGSGHDLAMFAVKYLPSKVELKREKMNTFINPIRSY